MVHYSNQLGATLNNAVITDKLDDKVTFVSATLQLWDNDTDNWGAESSITPIESEYSLGNINTPVLLKITAKVDTIANNIGHNVQTITNSATIKWDGLTGDGINSGNVNVNIGLNPITKTAGTYNASTHTIPWTVTVKDSDVDVNLRVLDLLVYADSDSDFDVDASYTINNNSGAVLTQVSSDDIKLLTPSYNQKYDINSFATTDDLEITVHTLKNTNGEAVADLIVVTKNDGTGVDVSSVDKSFTFNTIVTNPAIYLKNGSTDVYNTALLFSANTKINSAKAKAKCTSKMISKDMLTLSGAENLDPSQSTTNTSKGFNYIDKSVIYRLVVNANNISDVTNDITTIDGQTLGNVTVSDTLPDGWEFVEIESGKDFIFYEDSNVDGSITKDDTPISDTTAIFESTSITGKEADFVFKSLTKTYVILLKAKPLQTTIDDYFSDNQTKTVKNNVTLSAKNFSAGTSASQKVKITSEILSKAVPSSATDGVLIWEVEYKPYDIEHEGTKIEDTLPIGIDLRINSNGELDLTDDNIKVIELSLNSDGSYSDVSDIPLILNTNIFYNNSSRKLTYIIPESQKAYRLEYKTDVTGEPGKTLSNSVKLIDGIEIDNPVVKSYSVASADALATMQRSGWIKITKQDGSSNVLSGAEFTVYTADEKTIIRAGTTNTDGTLYLRGLPVGEYVLKETAAPSEYSISTTTYSVTVASDFKTSIDGKTGDNSNEIIIKNYKTGSVGDLKITKVLSGNATDASKDFEFTVEISSLNGTYSYIGAGGKPSGEVVFNADGKATFTLKGGESITITNLPKDSLYTVIENDYSADGYSTSKTGETGTIVADMTKTAEFINTKNTNNTDTPTTTEPPATTTDSSTTTEIPDTTEPPIITTNPDIPKYELSDVPDPNDSDSPDKIIVIQDDHITEITYIKTQKSDGTYEYIDKDEIPLSDAPKTGNDSRIPIFFIIIIVSLSISFIMANKKHSTENIK